jgi:hypothetical protein
LLLSAAGAIVSLVNGSIKAVDGPFTEAKELVGGYAVLEVRSKADAVELARRLMQIHKDHLAGLGRQLRGSPVGRLTRGRHLYLFPNLICESSGRARVAPA